MSGFFNIEQALIKAVKAIGLSYPMSEPNRELTNEQKGNGVWLKVSVLNGQTNVATLGDSGTDNNPGVLQIDVNVLQNKGAGQLLNVCDVICTNLHAGKGLQYQGQAVKLTGSSISGIRNVGGYARRSVSVRFYARTKRIV